MGGDSSYSNSKEFSFFGQMKKTLLHNGKGVDPLLSICNAIILKEDLILDGRFDEEWELVEFLRTKVEELCPDTLRESLLADAASRTPDLVDFEPKPVWNKIDSFKNNNFSQILEVLQIPMYHGWVINDADAEPKCFDDIGESASSPNERTMVDMKGQATEYGLYSLQESLKDHEIFVFVHDDRLHTAIKHEDQFYLLITEVNLNHMGLLWRKLDGGAMVGEDFQQATASSRSEEKEGNSSVRSDKVSIYITTKDFSFFGQKRNIVLHNGQGRDSLLSICNTLILRDNLLLDDGFDAESELIDFIRTKMEDLCPDTLRESLLPDAVSRIRSLPDSTPEPVWNQIDSFKNNDWSQIFEVLQIPVYHGWITSDENAEPKCFHEIRTASSDIEWAMSKARGGFTECGLSSLKASMKNHEICIFLYRGRFHTATKHEDHIYLLVPEDYSNVVGLFWRKLDGGTIVGENADEDEGECYEEDKEIVDDSEEEEQEIVDNSEEAEQEIVDNSEEEEVGAESQPNSSTDSESSMETHFGGIRSPECTLDGPNTGPNTSSSSSD